MKRSGDLRPSHYRPSQRQAKSSWISWTRNLWALVRTSSSQRKCLQPFCWSCPGRCKDGLLPLQGYHCPLSLHPSPGNRRRLGSHRPLQAEGMRYVRDRCTLPGRWRGLTPIDIKASLPHSELPEGCCMSDGYVQGCGQRDQPPRCAGHLQLALLDRLTQPPQSSTARGCEYLSNHERQCQSHWGTFSAGLTQLGCTQPGRSPRLGSRRERMIDGMNDGPVLARSRLFFSYFGLVIAFVLVWFLIGIDSILDLSTFVLIVFRLVQLTSSSLTFFEFGRRFSHLPRNWKKRKTFVSQLSSYYWRRNLELGVFGLVIIQSYHRLFGSTFSKLIFILPETQRPTFELRPSIGSLPLFMVMATAASRSAAQFQADVVATARKVVMVVTRINVPTSTSNLVVTLSAAMMVAEMRSPVLPHTSVAIWTATRVAPSSATVGTAAVLEERLIKFYPITAMRELMVLLGDWWMAFSAISAKVQVSAEDRSIASPLAESVDEEEVVAFARTLTLRSGHIKMWQILPNVVYLVVAGVDVFDHTRLAMPVSDGWFPMDVLCDVVCAGHHRGDDLEGRGAASCIGGCLVDSQPIPSNIVVCVSPIWRLALSLLACLTPGRDGVRATLPTDYEYNGAFYIHPAFLLADESRVMVIRTCLDAHFVTHSAQPMVCIPCVGGNGVLRTQIILHVQYMVLDSASYGMGPNSDSEANSAATLNLCIEPDLACYSETSSPLPSLRWIPQNQCVFGIGNQRQSNGGWLAGPLSWVLDPFPRVGIGTTHTRSEQVLQGWPPGDQRGTRLRRSQSYQTSSHQRLSNLLRPGLNPFGLNWRSRSWLSLFPITRLSMLDVGIDGPFLGTGSPFSYFGISFPERLLVLFSISLTVFRLLPLPSSSSTCPLFVFGSRVAPVAPWPRNWKKRRAREQESRSYHWWRNLEIGILGVTYVVFPLPSKDTEDLSDEVLVKSHYLAQQRDLSNGRMRNMFSLKNFVSVFIYILYQNPPVSFFVLGSPAREGARHE